MSNKTIHVAAGVIVCPDGNVLIARRHDEAHQGGLWEFPGGKLESDEPVKEALKRELHEELGIDIQQAHPLIRIHHDYPDKSVLLDVWKVTNFAGEVHGKEGQPVKWVTPEELSQFDFPEANKPIIKAVQLPDRYLITGKYESKEKALQHIQQRIKQGIKLIQFRANYLSDDEYIVWAKELTVLCRQFDVCLLLNRDIQQVMQLNPDGIHLSVNNMLACRSRPVNEKQWLSASVHNTEELERALLLGVDFVVIAPVLETQTHPGTEPLGWEKFNQLTEKATCPVYALGGMTGECIEEAQCRGAQGIAAIRGLHSE